MKAAVLVGYGGVDQLELREAPEPKTGPGQIKVQVVAASINPIDWKLRQGAALRVEGVVALDDEADAGRLPTLDGIADTIGGATTQKLVERVRAGGAVGTVVGEPTGARERGLEVRHVWAHPDPDRLASMVRAVAEGALVIPIAKRFPLSQIREAQELAEKGAGGKVLLRL